MTIRRFEDIIAWQKAQKLAVEVYMEFGALRYFSFKDQICRAVVSISNNIAEGFERKGDKQISYFLHVALGSSSEVKSMLYLGFDLKDISEGRKVELIEKC
ncbi:MAG: four helix bundle protein [Bacteroidetes bacterium]|nr:four helix bundle protein [Bacteroidota bacterium]